MKAMCLVGSGQEWGSVWGWELTAESKGVPPPSGHLSVECRCFFDTGKKGLSFVFKKL